jgi:hypothetical protein
MEDLLAEHANLEAALEEALSVYAQYEEQLNRRMKQASADDIRTMMAERERIEDQLGIAQTLERITLVRFRLTAIQNGEKLAS